MGCGKGAHGGFVCHHVFTPRQRTVDGKMNDETVCAHLAIYFQSFGSEDKDMAIWSLGHFLFFILVATIWTDVTFPTLEMKIRPTEGWLGNRCFDSVLVPVPQFVSS